MERLRDPRLDELEIPVAAGAEPGGRWVGLPRRGNEQGPGGEYMFDWNGRWRVATGDMADAVESPFAGIVRSVRPGTGITIRAAGRGIRGVAALGGPTRGRLHAGAEGELRSGGLDVGSAGTILVVGSRVDAETLTRARAMGVCGVVVAGLSSKERRDFIASEARQRAALHRLPPFAVLVLDGATRRPLAGRGPGRAGGPRRSRGGDRHGSADARLRPAEPGDPGPAGRPRPDPGGIARRPRGALRPGDRSAPVRRWRPSRSWHRAPARWDARPPSRSATSSASSDAPAGDRPQRRRGERTALPVRSGDHDSRHRAATHLRQPRSGRDDPRSGAPSRRAARAGDVICLWGDLGAGKTHLAKAFGAGLGVAETITSPSFILMAEYEGRLPLFHIDLYRLADASDALVGRPDRRPPVGRRHPRSNGRIGSGRRSPPSGST